MPELYPSGPGEWRNAGSPLRAFLRGLLGWALFGGLAICLVLLNPFPGVSAGVRRLTANRWHFAALGLFLFGHVLFFFVWFFVLRVIRRRATSEHRPLRSELVADGVAWSRGGVRREVRWSSFDGYTESAELFVLRLGDGSNQVVSKDTLSDGEQEGFRAALAAHVKRVS